MDAESKNKALRYIATGAGVIYRLLILAVLLWIGYGIQSIGLTLNTPVEDSCSADQSSAGPDQQDNQSQIIKPLLRGQM